MSLGSLGIKMKTVLFFILLVSHAHAQITGTHGPVLIKKPDTQIKVAALGYGGCVMYNQGVKCWGRNQFGAVGNNSTTDSQTAVAVTGLAPGTRAGVSDICGGDNHACVIRNGGVQCWGSNSDAQIGISTATTQRETADWVTNLGSGSGVTGLACGSRHTCAIVSGGVQCWGSRNSLGTGMLGDGLTTGNRFTPDWVTNLGSGSGVTYIGGGAWSRTTCAILNDGSMRCWGKGNRGELGIGGTSDSATPVTPTGFGAGSGVTKVSTGWEHVCAQIADGLKCWGYNVKGEIGTGNNGQQTSPYTTLAAGSLVKDFTTGSRYTCVRYTSGVMKCVGAHQNGVLGNGTVNAITYSTALQDVGNECLNSYSMASGGDRTFIVCANITGIRGWGSGQYYSLGNSSTSAQSSAVNAASGVPVP